MGKYLPYSGEHSIQEAVISIHFVNVFDPKVIGRARHTAEVGLKDVFSQFNSIQIQEIKINRNPPPSDLQNPNEPSRLGGFEFKKVKADAKPARVLRFIDKALTMHFLEYNNWKTTLGDGLKHIRVVLPELNLVENPITAFSLRYVDRYTFDGRSDEPRAEMLLQRGNVYIAAQCFDSGSFWHCHSGWFDPLKDGSRILNQLNVGSALVDTVPTATISHNAICSLKWPRQSVESLFQPSLDSAMGIENMLGYMHERNGSILKKLLLPEMLERIGMQP